MSLTSAIEFVELGMKVNFISSNKFFSGEKEKANQTSSWLNEAGDGSRTQPTNKYIWLWQQKEFISYGTMNKVQWHPLGSPLERGWDINV